MHEELYKKNTGLVHYICKKFGNLQIEYEELEACGNIAFTKCIKSFNPDASKFATYFSRVLTNEILMLQRKQKKHQEVLSLDHTIAHDVDGKAMKLEELVNDGTHMEQDIENKLILAQAMSAIESLEGIQKETMQLFIQGKNQHEIGKALGISQSYVSRVIASTQKKLRKLCRRGDFMARDEKKKAAYECFEKGNFDNKEVSKISGATIGTVRQLKTKWRREQELELSIKAMEEAPKEKKEKQEDQPVIEHIEEQENQEKQDEIQEVRSAGLRITHLKGQMGSYKLLEDKIAIANNDYVFVVEHGQIDTLIKELQEIKQYIS